MSIGDRCPASPPPTPLLPSKPTEDDDGVIPPSASPRAPTLSEDKGVSSPPPTPLFTSKPLDDNRHVILPPTPGSSSNVIEEDFPLHPPSTPRPKSRELPVPPRGSTLPKQGICKLEFDDTVRGAVISRSCRYVLRGELLLSLTPLMPTLHSALLDSHCAGCWRSENELRKSRRGKGMQEDVLLTCSRCKIFNYCGWRCVAKSAQGHFDECRALARLRGDMPSTLVRLISNFVWARRYKRYREVYASCAQPYYDLPLKYKVPQDVPIDMGRVDTFVQEVIQFVAIGQWCNITFARYRLKDVNGLRKLVRVLLLCLFPLYNDFAIPVGLCISPQLSRIGHSCTPNAVVVFPKGPLAKVGMRVVAMDPLYLGADVKISYVDPTIPIHLRQAMLATYGFKHDCAFCFNQKVDLRWCAEHEGSGERGHIALVDVAPLPNAGISACSIGQLAVTPVPTAACSTCMESISTNLSPVGYNQVLEVIRTEWEAEMDGVTAPAEDTDGRCALLIDKVEKIVATVPFTTYPFPHVFRRLARLHLAVAESAKKSGQTRRGAIISAVTYLKDAYDAVFEMCNKAPCLLTLGMGVELIEARLKLLIRLQEEFFELQAVPPIPSASPCDSADGDESCDRDLGEEKTQLVSTSEPLWSNLAQIEAYAKREKAWIGSNTELIIDTVETARDSISEAQDELVCLALTGSRLAKKVSRLDDSIDEIATWFAKLV